MSALRRCERCQTLNNTLVNDDHCYVCGQQWARDERAVVTDGGVSTDSTERSLHEAYEPEAPIHRAVNITYRYLKDRIEPVEHDEYDIWKAQDPETGRELRSWWDTPEEAVEMLAVSVDNELCYLNECATHLGEGSDRIYCDEHNPDEFIECAAGGCDRLTSHTETVHCSSHTWRNGRSVGTDTDRKPVTDGGQCRECGTDLPAGYLCPECDTVEVFD